MIARPSDFNDSASPKASNAFGAEQQGPTAAASAQVEAIPEVSFRAVGPDMRDQFGDAGTRADPATLAMEPEVIGGRNSTQRRCIVSNVIKSHEEMIRFVISPEGLVTPDLEGRLPGRGYWVTARHNELHKAVSTDVFAKASRGKAEVPPAMINTILTLARKSALNTLGLARRGWNVEFGYDHVRQAITAQKVGLILVASNVPVEISRKLDGVKGDIPVINLFTTAELSQALGRESLAFASVNKGQWTARLLVECKRLALLQLP